MLVSRKRVKAELVVMFLPLDSISEDSISSIYKKTKRDWIFPWSVSIVDDIAPGFKTIMEQYYFMLHQLFHLKKNDELLTNRIQQFEECLETLLRKIEDLWLGSRKCLLLREYSNCQNFDLVLDNLLKELKFMQTLDENEVIVKIILGDSKYIVQEETSISSQTLEKSGYIANLGYLEKF